MFMSFRSFCFQFHQQIFEVKFHITMGCTFEIYNIVSRNFTKEMLNYVPLSFFHVFYIWKFIKHRDSRSQKVTYLWKR